MKKSVKVGTPAKINLSLDIIGKRPDGYHLINSVMQSLTLSDTLNTSVSFLPKRAKKVSIILNCNLTNIPCDEKNTVYKAALAYVKETKDINIPGLGFIQKIVFDLYKNIPHEAGLAGGSSNAAGALFALNHICGGVISDTALMEMALSVGADVSFCLIGGTALCTGIGHIVKPLEYIGDYNVLLIKPSFGISTAEAYKALDSKGFNAKKSFELNGDKVSLKDLANANNDFEEYAKTAHEEIKTLIDWFKCNTGVVKVAMTGSGPTVFAIFEDDTSGIDAYNKIVQKLEFSSYDILLASTSPSGPYII